MVNRKFTDIKILSKLHVSNKALLGSRGIFSSDPSWCSHINMKAFAQNLCGFHTNVILPHLQRATCSNHQHATDFWIYSTEMKKAKPLVLLR